jgi:hypothetical protein
MEQNNQIDQIQSEDPEVQTLPSNQPETAKPAISEARLRANRENAKNSRGPRTAEGKARSSLNATRHGLLAQVIHLPEEEMASYNEFTALYVVDLAPVGAVETQLAHTCADVQFRLHRLAAAEHNLFAIGHDENGELWNTGHPESHAALTFAETLRRSKDPLQTLSIYEQRLSRRLLQTLKQLREMQAERRALDESQLEEMFAIVAAHPSLTGDIDPSQLGFVCSMRAWRLYYKRRMLLGSRQKRATGVPRTFSSRELLKQAA